MLSCNVLDMGRISGCTYWISPGGLIYDKPSNTRHVLHSFYFLGVAPLARMSWDLYKRKDIGDEIKKRSKVARRSNYYWLWERSKPDI